MYHCVEFSGKVTLSFSKLTTKELSRIIELDFGEMKRKIDYGEFVVPKIDHEYRHDCDGWEQPIDGLWNLTYEISSCGGIDKDSLVGWSKRFAKDLDTAEEIARYIEEKTGIKPDES